MKFFLLLTAYLAAANLLGFFLTVWDKSRAVHHRYRVPERTLLTVAAFGGALGMWIAMGTVRHKTRKLKFSIGVPLLLLAWVVFYCFIWVKIRGGV